MTRLAAAIAVFLLALPVAAARAQAPVFTSTVEAVRVDVLVTDGGKPVRGLGPSDFEIVDNGVPQRVDLVSFEQLPLNVILAFDMSDSVVGERLAHLREAGRAVLDGLKRSDQAALVTFNHAVSLGAALTGETRLVRDAVARAEPAGSTSLIDAAFAGLLLGESDVGRSLVIVFSDGLDTSSWLGPGAVLDVAKRSDVVVYAVATVQAAGGGFLRDLTEQTGGRLYEIGTTRDLSAVFLQVLAEFRERYLVSYSPTGVSKDGWHQLTTRVRGRNVTIRARPGYLAGQ